MFLYNLLLLVFYISSGFAEEPVPESPFFPDIPIDIGDDESTLLIWKPREHKTDLKSIIYAGLQDSEPTTIEHLPANLATLQYTLSNVNISGFSNIKLKNIAFNPYDETLRIQMYVPLYVIDGDYSVSGILLILPIVGQGQFVINAENYDIAVITELKTLQGQDDKKYIKVKNFKLKIDAGGPVTYKMTNLYNGNEQMSAAAHSFINNNWSPVTKIVQEPVLYAAIKKVIKNINVRLRETPVDDLLH